MAAAAAVLLLPAEFLVGSSTLIAVVKEIITMKFHLHMPMSGDLTNTQRLQSFELYS